MAIVPKLWIAFTNICFEEMFLPELLDSILARLLEPRALHHAVAKLRAGTVSKKENKKKKVSFLRWVPFVHLGR